MAIDDNKEVKEFTQTVKVSPSKDDETVDEEEESETPSSSSDEEKDSADEEGTEEEETEEETEEESTEESESTEEESTQEVEKSEIQIKEVEGETPKERALRLETTRLKGLLRKERADDLFVKPKVKQVQDEDLSEYDQDELDRFEKIALKMGFAKKDEIIQGSTQEKNNAEFESFIEAHPEYAPENDKDAILWNQFKTEFALYQPPQDPKTLRKVLNKVHNDIFGVKTTNNLNKINASKEKIKVASHTGASVVKNTPKPQQRNNSGLRLDALKGFDDKEKAELFG